MKNKTCTSTMEVLCAGMVITAAFAVGFSTASGKCFDFDGYTGSVYQIMRPNGWSSFGGLLGDPRTLEPAGLWRKGLLPNGQKQNKSNVDVLYVRRAQCFSHLVSMPIVIPQHKLALCMSPGVATATVRLLLLRLLGHSPSDLCPNGSLPNISQGHALDEGLWAGAVSLEAFSTEEAKDIFLSPEWTTVMIVRDPWYRSVGTYQDQVQHGVHTASSQRARDDFLEFTMDRKGYGWQAGIQATVCCNQFVDYDFMIEVEEIEAGFEALLKYLNLPKTLILEGWEDCAQRPSLFGASRSFLKLDEEFCDAATVSAVFRRFAADYAFLTRQKVPYSMPHACGWT
mmetsp:Transcript_29962/g.54586  ORF Transcript_29962/g.54586 Transcript_29962/m.54586 type:complete len:341 (-) Transcript_29962:50-1072(-)